MAISMFVSHVCDSFCVSVTKAGGSPPPNTSELLLGSHCGTEMCNGGPEATSLVTGLGHGAGKEVLEGTPAQGSQAQQLLSYLSFFPTTDSSKAEGSQLITHSKNPRETQVPCPGVSFCGSTEASETVFKEH